MRIVSVRADAFGPFEDRTLDLSPGMNVVFGANEAGKSTWHAALYAGLCGMRRQRGLTTEVREFKRHHSPWHQDRWEVGTVVELADGRSIELWHDLAGSADCQATDLTTGESIVDELVYEGAPDGSKLLGLNRRTMLSSVCVRQADVLDVLHDADGLQTHLQRAAATGGADATAQEAIERIEDFRHARIGSTVSHSTKPLRRAHDRRRAARERLDRARAEHDDYLDLLHRHEQARDRTERAELRLRTARALAAREELEDLDDRLADAERLAEEERQPQPENAGRSDPATDVVNVAAVDASAGELRRLADDLEAPVPEVDQELVRQVETEGASGGDNTMPRVLFAGAGLAGLSGVALLATGQELVGVGLVIVAAVLAATGVLAGRGGTGTSTTTAARLAVQREQREQAVGRRQRATQRLRELGCPADPREVQRIARAIDEAEIGAEHARRLQRNQDYLRERVADLRTRIERRRATLPPMPDRDPDGAPVELAEDVEAQIDLLQRQADEARSDADHLNGQVEDRQRNLVSVAEAEEAREQAEAELERVRQLDATLGHTLEFLDHARERVQRDIAPQLVDTIEGRLSQITGGRYDRVTVDPDSLAVKVRTAAGQWRPATQLSHGTAEQVYLLLRVALAEHITTGEPAPLILDDVTVQSDHQRTTAFLDLLHDVAGERQVVLFSQEREVLAWARDQLTDERDLLTELDVVPTGA